MKASAVLSAISAAGVGASSGASKLNFEVTGMSGDPIQLTGSGEDNLQLTCKSSSSNLCELSAIKTDVADLKAGLATLSSNFDVLNATVTAGTTTTVPPTPVATNTRCSCADIMAAGEPSGSYTFTCDALPFTYSAYCDNDHAGGIIATYTRLNRLV
jgi:hypothetical protein